MNAPSTIAVPEKPDALRSRKRITGYDFARALAIFGMVIVNFKIVMGAEKAGPHWLLDVFGLLDGRAAATFVVLAGVGLSLMTRRARLNHDAQGLATNRIRLLKRALFLFVVGLCYTPLWPADILHFYGIYIAVGALVLAASDRRLWGLAAAFVIGFVLMLFVLDYETGWDWETLSYSGFWTARGMIRHLFYNGFHPVFPWTAFLLVGMWLGRKDLRDTGIRKRVLLLGLTVAVLAEGLSWILIGALSNGAADADVAALFGTEPMPPMPLYLLTGAGTAIVVIAGSIALTERFATARWIQPIVSTGRLALTLYVAHVVIGMGTLETLGLLENQSPPFAIGSALLFCVLSVGFAHLWKQRFQQGPLEWVMRRLTG